MSSPQSQKVDLQQVNQLWSMLDEMRDSDPESYRTFIQRQLKEGAEFCSPPTPDSCLRTVIQEPEERLLYINLCAWKRVPAPQSKSHPLPVIGGKLETVVDGNETYSVLDMAFHPDVLQRVLESRQEREQLHLLALSFAQEQHGLRLSQDYSLLGTRLKGSTQSMRHRLASPHLPRPSDSTPTPTATATGPSLLQQISSLREEQEESRDSPSVRLTPQRSGNPGKPPLIQVISSTPSVLPQRPKHRLSITTGAAGTARSVQLTVELPGVRSVSECQLSVSQDDVLLEVEDMYHLHLELPEAVREDDASAVFNRKKRELSVTVPVL
ncbi:PIH1 domain-containing protein 2 [Megalops cyprinoides]|uniref:PIH1 domain-containing protein 2 n=1 Tax=Megalops cyprinoides TaxID=118141 RepID=UPI001863E03D|nr:PIH1 domain-containing protein 2 [Megalops cyprinoides]